MRFSRINLLALTTTLSLTVATVLAPSSYAFSSLQRQRNVRAVAPKTTKVAQVFRTNISLPAGQSISTKLANNETLYIQNGETKATKLRVERDIVSSNGVVLIPTGAIIEGEFVPVSGGSKFIARNLVTRNVTVSIGAESALIHDVKDPRKGSIGGIVTDAAIGAAGAAILSGVIGDRVIATEKVLGGAAAGVILGNITAAQVTVIDSNNMLSITTNRNLTFSSGGD